MASGGTDMLKAPAAAALPALSAELLEECGRLPLPPLGGLPVDVPPYGPPLSLADAAPSAGRLFVATARAVAGFRLPAALSGARPGCGEPAQLLPEVEVPLLGRAMRLRCGELGGRPLVAVVDNSGMATVFWADVAGTNGRWPRALRLRCPGTPPARGLAVGPCAGDPCGGCFLYVGNSLGQFYRWHLRATADDSLAAGPAVEFGAARMGVSDVAIVDIDVAMGVGILAARLDGRLALWVTEPARPNSFGLTSPPRLRACSEAAVRVDCAETPTLWGSRWIPLRVVPAIGAGEAPIPPGDAAWASLPIELVCRAVLPFLPLRTLACRVAPLARAYRGIAERELLRPARGEHLALCFSDCTAWLLDAGLRVLARQDLPFCAAHSHAVVVPGLAAALVAPKTDLVALPGSSIVAVPHLWVLTVYRHRGCWQPWLQVRRLDLRQPSVTAAADVSGRTAAWGRPAAAPPPVPPRPKEPTHVMGSAVSGAELMTLLASGELLVHRLHLPREPG